MGQVTCSEVAWGGSSGLGEKTKSRRTLPLSIPIIPFADSMDMADWSRLFLPAGGKWIACLYIK